MEAVFTVSLTRNRPPIRLKKVAHGNLGKDGAGGSPNPKLASA